MFNYTYQLLEKQTARFISSKVSVAIEVEQNVISPMTIKRSIFYTSLYFMKLLLKQNKK